MKTPSIYQLRIKNEYANAILRDLQKMDAVELVPESSQRFNPLNYIFGFKQKPASPASDEMDRLLDEMDKLLAVMRGRKLATGS